MEVSARPSKPIVAAIDIGTAYSGYAFSFKSDYRDNPLTISANMWFEKGHKFQSDAKISTTVLLNPDQSFHSFGFTAENKFAELSEDFDDEECQKWYYFEKFKMKLYHEKSLHRNIILKDIFGKEMPALTIFSMVIKYFKETMLGNLKNRGLSFSESDILWVLTVPAIWSDSAKQFMREAAREAGISGRDIILAYEPEAIAMFCKCLPKDQLSGTGPDIFTVGKKIMMIDIGGGTADFTVQKVMEGRKLQSVFSVSGGPWGGEVVNTNFLNFIKDMSGTSVLDQFKTNYMSDYLELMHDFESKKREFGETKDITLRLPSKFSDVHREVHKKSMSESIKSLSSFSTSIQFKRDKMRIDKYVFRDFFKEPKSPGSKNIMKDPEEPIEAIVNHIKKLMAKSECAGLLTLIMAGGFSESNLVINAIRQEFPGLQVIVPMSPGLAVLKGAVIFGHSPETIGARYCAQTYGISLNKEFDPRRHSGGKTYRSGGRTMCEDCFQVLFKLGEVVDVGYTRSIEVYSSHESDDRQKWRTDVKEIEIYTSSSVSPTFVTDSGCKLHAKITVVPPGGEWPTIVDGKIEMEVGGTEITVRYIDNNSPDITSSASVDFMWYSDTERGQVTAVDRDEERVFYPESMVH